MLIIGMCGGVGAILAITIANILGYRFRASWSPKRYWVCFTVCLIVITTSLLGISSVTITSSMLRTIREASEARHVDYVQLVDKTIEAIDNPNLEQGWQEVQTAMNALGIDANEVQSLIDQVASEYQTPGGNWLLPNYLTDWADGTLSMFEKMGIADYLN